MNNIVQNRITKLEGLVQQKMLPLRGQYPGKEDHELVEMSGDAKLVSECLELKTLRGLATSRSAMFLRFRNEWIRFDRIERFETDEEGYVTRVYPLNVSFSRYEGACIRAPELVASIAELYEASSAGPG